MEKSNSQTFPHLPQSNKILFLPRITVTTTPAVPTASGEALTEATVRATVQETFGKN